MQATTKDIERYLQMEAYWEGRADEARAAGDQMTNFDVKRQYYQLAIDFDQRAAQMRASRHQQVRMN